MKKTLGRSALAVLFAICLIFVTLITSAEVLLYGPIGWFEREYTKYDVLSDVNGEMSMTSALQVTDEMMAYLRGNREDLVVMTTIDSEETEFFTNREKAHLADCQVLFVGAIWLRNIAAALCVAIAIGLLYSKETRRNELDRLARLFAPTAGIILGLSALLAVVVASDFNKYFVVFHQIFFDNNLWILYPDRDNLINLLPEGFFVDTSLWIVSVFLVAVAFLCVIAIRLHRRLRTHL